MSYFREIDILTFSSDILKSQVKIYTPTNRASSHLILNFHRIPSRIIGLKNSSGPPASWGYCKLCVGQGSWYLRYILRFILFNFPFCYKHSNLFFLEYNLDVHGGFLLNLFNSSNCLDICY